MGAHLAEARKKLGRNLIDIPRQGQAPQKSNDKTRLGLHLVIEEYDPTVGTNVGGTKLPPNDSLHRGLPGLKVKLGGIHDRHRNTEFLGKDGLGAARRGGVGSCEVFCLFSL